jgi:hypothetical protein
MSLGSKRMRWPILRYGTRRFGDEAPDVAFVDTEAVGDVFESHE